MWGTLCCAGGSAQGHAPLHGQPPSPGAGMQFPAWEPWVGAGDLWLAVSHHQACLAVREVLSHRARRAGTGRQMLHSCTLRGATLPCSGRCRPLLRGWNLTGWQFSHFPGKKDPAGESSSCKSGVCHRGNPLLVEEGGDVSSCPARSVLCKKIFPAYLASFKKKCLIVLPQHVARAMTAGPRDSGQGQFVASWL